MINLPTSDLVAFQQQILTPNIPVQSNLNQQTTNIAKIQKNIVLSFVSDSTGCGHIRNIFPLSYLNALHGKTGRFNLILSPAFIWQEDILMRTRSMYFQRTMSPEQVASVQKYSSLKSRFGYKLVYDIDDFIWRGPAEGESIPEYNFGSMSIQDDTRAASLQIMNMMDVVCVSTEFLKQYIASHGVTKPIEVIDNVVPKFFWGNTKKKPIKEKLQKPKVIYTGSPTHYCNQRQLLGDWDNAWKDWVIKNVKDNKIEFFCMGGLPFFFKEIENKIKVLNWVNSWSYHIPIKDFKPDFSIAPLVPNFFNYSKSNLKYIESCAYGALFMGNVWKGTQYDKFPSPYDVCESKVPYDISLEKLDQYFWEHTEPEKYNEVINNQYNFIINKGLYMESKRYTNLLTTIF